jgi:hypothetical protein
MGITQSGRDGSGSSGLIALESAMSRKYEASSVSLTASNYSNANNPWQT